MQMTASETPKVTEIQLAAMLDKVSSGIYAVDPDWRFSFINQAAERFLGLTRDEAIGADIWKLLPAVRGTAIERALRGAMENQEEVHGEFGSAVRPDRCLDLRATPVDGGIAVIFSDITERKAAGEALRANEELLRHALGIGRMIAYEWDLATWTVTRSSSAEGVFAHLPDTSDAFISMVHPDDVAVLRAQAESVARGDRDSYVAEYRVIAGDGNLYWISSRSRITRDKSGKPVRLAGVAQDITEHKLREQSLADSEERLRLATDVGGLGAWDWNMATGEVAWSDQHFPIMGYAIGEVVPSYEAWMTRIHPDDRPDTEAALADAMRRRAAYSHEFRVVHPDGTQRHCEARGRFIYDAAGKPTRMIGVMQDVTVKREAVARQRMLLGELQHRVRNTLAVVRSIARRTGSTAGTVEDYTAHFDGRLNAFARTQAAVTRDPAAGVDLEALVAEEMTAHGAREGHQVEISGPVVRLQPKTAETLGLAVHELATNAVKYGALASPEGRIVIAWRFVRSDDADRLVFEWRETDLADPVPPPRRRGFGTELLERTLAYDLGAETELRFAPGGVECTIVLPVDGRTLVL
jgi:PAS domain S-box-containing protein